MAAHHDDGVIANVSVADDLVQTYWADDYVAVVMDDDSVVVDDGDADCYLDEAKQNVTFEGHEHEVELVDGNSDVGVGVVIVVVVNEEGEEGHCGAGELSAEDR